MHGLIFETSVWLLAESTRLLFTYYLRAKIERIQSSTTVGNQQAPRAEKTTLQGRPNGVFLQYKKRLSNIKKTKDFQMNSAVSFLNSASILFPKEPSQKYCFDRGSTRCFFMETQQQQKAQELRLNPMDHILRQGLSKAPTILEFLCYVSWMCSLERQYVLKKGIKHPGHAQFLLTN